MEKDLQLAAVLGFRGKVPNGLVLHPDNEHMIFPLGSTLVVRHVISRTQRFLFGHDNDISVITTSRSGKYIASGQVTHMGFQADVIIWDFETLDLKYRMKLHKVSINSISFSPNEKFVITAGGQDDNTLVVWDTDTGKAVAGTPTMGETINEVRFYNNSNSNIVSVHNGCVRLWDLDVERKKILPTLVNLGNVKRNIINLTIDPTDQFAYCGTKTGDFIEVNLERANFKRLGPQKRLFSLSILTINQLPNGDILVGTGEGVIAKIGRRDFKVKGEAKVIGPVTSIALTADGTHFFIGTRNAMIYWCDSDTLKPELRSTGHYEKINDIAFPFMYSDVFATCSMNDIRVWNAKNRQELLRIEVPNLECHCVGFMQDGKSIISGWGDGKIRSFLPQSGKLFYAINDAHNHGVTAIASTSDCQRIVSGGMEGEVRVWKIGRQTQIMQTSLKEHRSRVSGIKISNNNENAISCSFDGSTIIWDLNTYQRCICLFESTMFREVLYHPNESQVLTTGSNRKITYWDIFDGEPIRMLDASEDSEMNTLDITAEGEHFVSGGEDKVLRVWDYDEGISYFKGIGHPGAITKVRWRIEKQVKIAPNQKFIVSAGSEGAIMIWHMPESVQMAKADKDMPTAEKDD